MDNYTQPLKFNLPASIYDELYNAKMKGQSVEIVLCYEHVDNKNGFDLLYFDRRMIYQMYKFNSLSIILV